MLDKLGKLFTRYPQELGICPGVFKKIRPEPQKYIDSNARVVVFQLVPDKFYFLLFGAIVNQWKVAFGGRCELVVVRAASAAIGFGWIAELKRSAFLTWLSSGPWVRAYGELIDGIAYRCATWGHPIDDLTDWFQSGRLWGAMQQQDKDFSLQINGIEVADLVIDSYLRFRPSPEFNSRDPFVRRLLWQALRDVRQAQAYFVKSNPSLYLTSYSTYLEHGIPVRVALRQGVKVLSFGNLNRFGKKLSVEDSYHTQDFSSYRKIFDTLDNKQERLEQARRQLEGRLSGITDTATSYMRQSAYAGGEVDLPKDLKGAVVVFLHDFYDSPHVYPELVFQDFWDWICFTIEVLQAKGIPFFLKPHPNQIALSDKALQLLRQKYTDLKWLSSAVSNVRLVEAGIACGITVYGTVAHELAFVGVHSICCARHPHYTFDFCRTAKTREEYQFMLESFGMVSLSKEEMQRQALIFYYMHNLYGIGDELELRKAYVALWRICNMDEGEADGAIEAFQKLVGLPSFGQYVLEMTSSHDHHKS